MFLGRTVEYTHPLFPVHKTIYLLSRAGTQTQREGMGLLVLEYQVMPFLRDVGHDKWLLIKISI
jgi:hypothetical protein